MQKILLLEDDRNLNRGISLKLEKEGYQVFSAFSAKELFDAAGPDLIISDVNLPDKSGLDFCREIRKKSQVYLIFLTALDSEVDMVNAYDLGADDYITKPFSLLVLVSKVHALMRRARQAARPDAAGAPGRGGAKDRDPLRGDPGILSGYAGIPRRGRTFLKQKGTAASSVFYGERRTDPFQRADPRPCVGCGWPVCG